MISNLPITNKFTKTLISVVLLSSTSAYAHETCNVELEAGLTINNSIIEFFEEKHKNRVLYSIDSGNNLTVRGERISLDHDQQAMVKEYSENIRAMVPQVRHIAIEGVDLALEGVNLAFNELLGEGNDVGADLTKELYSLREEVANRFTIEHGFTLGENGLDDDELLGKEFEERIESAVEKAVMGSMGSLLVALGQEMMFSGGDSDAFETKMESFGESIENEMELRAEKIERKADSLCQAAVDIDLLEEKLRASISPLANINVITAKHTRGHDDKDKSAM